MSPIATDLMPAQYNNDVNQLNNTIMRRSSSNSSNLNSVVGRDITVRSAAPLPTHKETVHACPLCNSEYKDPRVLPCTHTYCFNCIRDQLVKNMHLTCSKCHFQVS
jgi:hypothetical protein